MPDLRFEVVGAEAVAFAAEPLLALKVRVDNATGEPVHGILLRCQVQIDAARRRYEPAEQERLRDLFGMPARWSETVRSLLWAHVCVAVPAFSGSVVVDVTVPCHYDFDRAPVKFLYGVDGGEAPLSLLFSGTVFHEAPEGAVRATPVPWSAQATFRLPVRLWTEVLQRYHPNGAVLTLRRDVFDRLFLYKTRRGLPTWEHALESLLPAEVEPPR